MAKVTLLLILALFNSIFPSREVFKCGEEVIDHCTKCNTGENSDSCEKCEDKYFPFFNDLLCLPCNDSTYGQIGCQGNCDGSNYVETRFAFCEKGGCKEGYYNLNGICMKCGKSSPNCINCTYEVQEESTEGNFICHQCENNTFRLTEYGTCEKCYIAYCEICHYNNTKAVCDKCYNGYYINSNGSCSQCYDVYITGGYCHICSDNNTAYETGNCWCDSGYTLVGHSKCFNCPNSCSQCLYNNQTNKTECQYCYGGYTLTPDKNCTYCGNGCESCTLDEKGNTNCTSCYSGTFLSYNNCLICSTGCYKCEIDKSSLYKNESKCTQCYYYYALSPYNNCTYCRDAPDTGDGCYHCEYNDKRKKYQCLSCWDNDYYAYITNDFQCFSNIDSEQVYLYGCLRAISTGPNGTYECQQCKYDFIQIVNDRTCRKYNEINISPFCLVVENLGTPEDPLYSCRECPKNYANITINSKGQKNCYSRTDNYIYCLEGKIEENGNQKCTRCVQHAIVNSSGICNCNFNSFGKYNEWCYRCDDKDMGNQGCYAYKGCNYTYSNDELDCNECRSGFFEYTRGQCFICGLEINNCEKCHFDEKLICDKCISIFSPNEEKNKCEIDECLEYPEISPGCIICKDNLNEYKINKKCQTCKYGYFKTKNETCVYCRGEKYGGPGCYECGYEEDENGKETNNIICKDCYSINNYNEMYYYYYNSYYNKFNSALSSDGKCYHCNEKFLGSCIKCEFNKENDANEKLRCIVCALGYYLDSEGNCVSYIDKIEVIPNCYRYYFYIENLRLYFYYDNSYDNIYFSYSSDEKQYYNNYSYYNQILKNLNNSIQTFCENCRSGYYMNSQGKCEILDIEKCKGNFISGNRYYRIRNCRDLCYQKDFPFIYVRLINNSLDLNFEQNKNNNSENIDGITLLTDILYDDYYYYYKLNYETRNIINNIPICYNIYTNEILKAQFEGCEKVIYIPKIETYQCLKCYSRFSMDENHKCHKNIYIKNQDQYCDFENIGTDSSPLYSCKNCYYSEYTLVTFENGVKSCIRDDILENCINVYADSSYLKPSYECTSCKMNYLPYYSKYFGRTICQNVYEKIIKNNSISLNKFQGEEFIPVENDGICRKYYFTPDGINCYKCDNKNVGMPGCKGECSFSLNRSNTILCESECKDEYIESSPGICETCNSINKGCVECHYENNYPSNYFGIKRARRFQCNYCREGYVLSDDGICLTCDDLGFYNCEKCEKDEKTGNYKCIECPKNYFWDESGFGECLECFAYSFILNNICIQCSDNNNGGIEGCSLCEKNEKEEIICRQCQENYILFSDNNTCIKREKNIQLKQFDTCLELKSENGKILCSRCKPELSLSLLKTENGTKCTYTPTLYDSNFNKYYYYHYYYEIFKRNYNEYYNYMNNDYNYRQNYLFPCKESINIGTTDNPLYSCTKCYNVFENEDYDFYYYDYYYYDYYYENFYTKIIDNSLSNISYCMQPLDEAENCTDAIYKLLKGKEIYNCTKCIKDNILLYNEDLDIYYCGFNQRSITKCLVDYCKKCSSNSNYFCSDCITSDYEVNKYSGSCVKKTEVKPAVTWKDIYRLNMNDQKEINGQTITGPSLNLRGITSNQINTRHAFLIYLTFKIKHGLRNLQETIKIPAICVIKEAVEETDDSFNIVDYECIGNSTVNENYTLSGIEEDNNSENTISGNMKEINTIIENTEDLTNKTNSSIDIGSIINNIIFCTIENDIKDNILISSNGIFNLDFKLTTVKPLNYLKKSSSILRNLEDFCSKKFQKEMNKTGEEATCYLCSDMNSNTNLSCSMKLNDDKSSTNLTFIDNEIEIEELNQTIFIPKLNKIILYYEKQNEKINEMKTDENNNGSNIENDDTKDSSNGTEITPDEEKKKASSSNNKALIIGLSVAGAVLVLGSLTAILVYCLKFKKNARMKNIENIHNVTEVKKYDIIKSDTNLG